MAEPTPPPPTPEASEKLARLEGILRGYGSALVAYSGGVDSTFLAVVAHRVLGGRALAVTAQSLSLAPEELEEAKRLAVQFGFAHEVVRTQELDDPNYANNPHNRCYFCKSELMTRLLALAQARGLARVALGAIVDDLGDFRPGETASAERGGAFPLREAGLLKAEIRSLSRELGLPTADKPGGACLASRVPFGEPVTAKKLQQIAGAEALLHRLGFENCRVRHHDAVARIEVPPERLAEALDRREELTAGLRELGFVYVTLDLQGLRSGSLHEAVRVAAGAAREGEGSGRS